MKPSKQKQMIRACLCRVTVEITWVSRLLG